MKPTSKNTSSTKSTSSSADTAHLDEIPATAETGGTMNRSDNSSSQQASGENANQEPVQDVKQSSQGRSSRQSFSDENHGFSGLSAALTSGFPDESRENLENLFLKGRDLVHEARTYVRDNPAEAAGLLAASGAVLWALLGTRPGRHLLEIGSPKLSHWLATGINETFQVQPKNLQ